MTYHDGRALRAALAYDETLSDALVVTVPGCAMAGFSLDQTDCWNVGWQALGAAMPPDETGAPFGQFHGLDRALLGEALQATQTLATALARRGSFVRAPRDDEPLGFDLCPRRRLH